MKEFQYCFAVERGIVFEVKYYTLGSNKSPHFSTEAALFNRPRTDYNQCGQSQDDLLKGKARAFWKKWDKMHLKNLTPNLYIALVADIDSLKKTYPNFVKTDGQDIPFSQVVAVERAFRGVVLK